MKPSKEPSVVCSAQLFENVGEPARARIMATFARRTLEAGEHLWWGGEQAEHVVWVERGLLQIVRLRTDGALSILGLFGPGDFIGLNAALEGAVYPADAVVLSQDAQVSRVSAAIVRSAAATDGALANNLLRILLSNTHVLLTKVAVVGAGSVAARLAMLLVHLAKRHGAPNPTSKRTRVELLLSRATLAGFVDARVETVIRTLGTFRDAGTFTTTETGFEIDAAALHAVAMGA